MDALKSATNIGTTTTSQQSGQEPVSGQEGAGTATQPFDQGNAEGKEGAGPEEGMSGALQDTKEAASDVGGGKDL